jgi:hypothetical protein
MQFRSKMMTTAAVALMALAGATIAAAASCHLAGDWKLQTLTATGGTCLNCHSANTCDISIAANGDITGLCTAYSLTVPTNFEDPITGNFQVDADCNLSGSHVTPGFEAVTIRGGHINNKSGTAIGTRGPDTRPTQVRLINLSKY